MANNVDLVVAGSPKGTGGILVAEKGTELPTDASSDAEAAGFAGAGYVSEEGLTEATERSTEKIKAWGGDTVKILQSDFSVTYAFKFIEALNEEALKIMYGDENVESTPGANGSASHIIKVKSDKPPARAYVFDMQDSDVGKVRICVPDGRVTEVGEQTYVDADVTGYELTVEALPDEDGVVAYKYFETGGASS